MPGMIYVPRQENPYMQQGMNMLQQLAMMKFAHNMRMEERDREIAEQKVRLDQEKRESAELSGYTPANIQRSDAGGAMPEGMVTIGGQPYNKPKPQVYKLGGQDFVMYGGKLVQVDKEKANQNKLPKSYEEYMLSQQDPKYAKFLESKQAAGKPGEPNFQVTMTPDGGVQVFTGSGQPTGIPLGNAAKGEVEKKLVGIDESLGKVRSIVDLYKPEYQQLGTKWNNLVTSVREKMGYPIASEDKQALREFSDYRKTAVSTMNEEIKRITGAQMSEAEAKRLKQGMPNPGTGLLDGDSPTEFESGLKGTYRNLMKAKARLMYLRARGLGDNQIKQEINSGKAVSLEAMDTIINNRAAQIERDIQLRSPGMPQEDIVQVVRKTLKQEFGIE